MVNKGATQSSFCHSVVVIMATSTYRDITRVASIELFTLSAENVCIFSYCNQGWAFQSKNATRYSHASDVIRRSLPLPGGIASFPGKNNEQYVFWHNDTYCRKQNRMSRSRFLPHDPVRFLDFQMHHSVVRPRSTSGPRSSVTRRSSVTNNLRSSADTSCRERFNQTTDVITFGLISSYSRN